MIYRSKNVKETEKIAADFIQKVLKEPKKNYARIIGLFGDLGAGKTEFLKGVAKTLKIKDTITSPTFVIEKFYKITTANNNLFPQEDFAAKQSKIKNQSVEFFNSLIHIDAYRIENSDEILKLGWKEIVGNPKNLIFIEWPERLLDILPRDMDNIYLTFIDKNIRDIEVKENNLIFAG